MKNEDFRVPEREELPQEEKYDEKTRGPELQKMPEEGEENERFANQKVRRWQNHWPQTRNGSRPTNYLRRQILFPEARHGQFITFEVKTEWSYRREIRAGRKNFTETNRS